eukprot:TRINITY_DN13445_c0_g1_i2.p1 TRINITY_DN13445_c0_g1~~TRINITY_DN13445_c0_g1_i2.p1  ORF type:complete len:774 (+),score=194.61 TRINITY_DN13445_c0_g1_i2:886-3207(+)
MLLTGGPEVPLKNMKPPNLGGADVEHIGPRTELQLDPVSMRKLRDLSAVKQRAVADEDYDAAKRLKEHIDALKMVGARLLQLDQQKRAAVLAEDYDLAKALKDEVDGLRAQALGLGRPASRREAWLQPKGPLQALPPVGGAAVATQTADAVPGPGAAPLREPPPPLEQPRPVPSLDDRPLPPPQQQPSAPPPDSFEERPAVSRALAEQIAPHQSAEGSGEVSPAVPAAYRRDINELLNDPDPFNMASKPTRRGSDAPAAAPGTAPPGAADGSADAAADVYDVSKQPPWERDIHARIIAIHPDAQYAPPLPEAKARDNSEYGVQFGELALRCLFGRQWHARDAAVRALASKLAAASDGAPCPGERRALVTLFIRYLLLKGHGVHDPIVAVFHGCADALRILLASELPQSVAAPLQSVAMALLPKTAEVCTRTREQASELLMIFAASPIVGPERVSACVMHEPEHSRRAERDPWRGLHARAVVTAMMLERFGINTKELRTGLSAETVMTRIVQPALQSPQDEVRKLGARICGQLHSLGAGKAVARHTQMVKPALKAAIARACGGSGDHFPPELAHGSGVSGGSADGGGGSSARRRAPGRAPPQGAAPRAAGASPTRQSQPQSARSPAGPPAESSGGAADDEEFVCQFCGRRDPRFTEQVLDLHYLHSCPALFQCQLCEQVVEIMMLSEHWLNECEKKGMRQCARCQAAVPLEQADAHAAAGDCAPHDPSVAVCVLCQARFPAGEDAWERHLLRDGCPKNPRGVGNRDGVEFQQQQ